jgi:hypothetical protein
MTVHKITEFFTEWFSVNPNITSKFRTITIFKSFIGELITQVQLTGMSVIFCGTRSCKFNDS